MPAIVNKVIPNSIAEEIEISAGDEILSIDDTKMLDMIDYNFLCKSDFLTLEVKKLNGEIEVIDLKAEPERIKTIVDGTKYLPGFHMNKKHWFTIKLDKTVPISEICCLIDESREIV